MMRLRGDRTATRRRARRWASVLALFAWPATARGQQLDTNPPQPNVLILLDNSGSMDREIDGTLPENAAANNCNCNATTGACNWSSPPAEVNRWGTVVQAMTGTLANGYNCASMPRTSGSVFAQEYSINGNPPYDLNYYINFHQVVAQDTTVSPSVPCVMAPGSLGGATSGQGVGTTRSANPSVAATAFFSGDVVSRQYSQLSTTTSSCQFAQLPNGAIDTMTNLVRFGLMTFDNDPGPGTGVTGPASSLAVSSTPFTGMWSYYPGWNGVGSPSFPSGFPIGCTTPQVYVVGARNPAAPPWEGRMVGFPTGATTQAQANAEVQEVVLASRPYGGTPLAGMLTDAQYYFQTDPNGPLQTDPYVQGGCRTQNIIILTDGLPNEDMRPGCAGTGGGCPFAQPWTIAQNLFTTTTGSPVVTYVIGFALSSYSDPGGSGTCSSLVANGSISNACSASNPYLSPTVSGTSTPNPNYDANLAACCELEQIAVYGGSTHAYFADSPGDLQSALGSILGRITQNATTRAVPAYSPVITNVIASATTPNQDIFYASFTPSVGQPWSGDIQRSRFFCPSSSGSSGSSSASSSMSSSSSSSSTAFNALQGDDFAQNLNSQGGFTRTFIAFEPTLSSPGGSGWNSIRPFIASTPPDGVTTFGATTYAGPASNVIPNIQPAAIQGINMATGPTQGCPYTPNNALGTQYMTPTQCASMVLDFAFAQPATAFSGPSNFTFSSRFGNAFGDIYHATPMVVGPPGSLLEDPSYQAFQLAWSNNVKCGTSTSGSSSSGSASGQPRPTTVYAATNDGLLHAFWADETTLENNEQWAMLMPEAYQNILSTYPSNHIQLLDGSPVVKDVVWDRSISTNTSTAWHTMLVAGYGPAQAGYYAVDITNPCPPTTGSTASGQTPASGPVFRWQLTPPMPSGNYPIFGSFAATPAITTLFMNPDGAGSRDIGVAILPGGWNGPPTNPQQCTRQAKTAAQVSTPPNNTYVTRPAVQCWAPSSVTSPTTNTPIGGGRSVAIVRLDTGEIVRVFASAVDTAPYPGDTLAAKGRIISVPFDSPMTGTPVVYPSDVGADTTKFFIGDADGGIWRFNVSDPNPSNWTASLFLDLYNTTVDTNPTTTSWQDGQPLEVTPVISLNSQNQLVINAATGTTESYTNSGIYYVYSITETPQGSPPALAANVNWYFGPQSAPSGSPSSTFRQGERVSGPMTVFNGSLYFASYYAGNLSTASCTNGDARIWGMDFETPFSPSGGPLCTANPSPCRGNGGVFTLNQTPPSGFVDVGQSFPGRVVPGVAVQATPACGTLTAAQDNYIGNTTHQVTSSFTPGAFSLVGLVGGIPASNGMSENPFSIALPTPTAPTLINSWAAVLE